MFEWLRERHRRELLRHPFPTNWLRTLESNVAHWRFLNDEERDHLRRLIQVFVPEKTWEGCGGLVMTDEIRVTIAGLACLLILGHDHDLYRNVQSILVYPSTVVTPGGRSSVAAGLALEKAPVPILGQAMEGGPVLLVWDAVRRDATHPAKGHNVVYHEFAHKLDMLDGSINGAPPLPDRERQAHWARVCRREYDDLQRDLAEGTPTFLDPYAGTNPGEFFAVATEYFFDRPIRMQREHAELYAVLQDFYRQDPAAREARWRTLDDGRPDI